MEAPSLTSLDDRLRHCIMLLLPVPDLLRLSATRRSFRSDMFRLMHGDLAVQIQVSFPNDKPHSASTEQRGTANEISFRAFLAAGGAALVKSLALSFGSSVRLGAQPLAWPPMPELESLTVTCSVPLHTTSR